MNASANLAELLRISAETKGYLRYWFKLRIILEGDGLVFGVFRKTSCELYQLSQVLLLGQELNKLRILLFALRNCLLLSEQILKAIRGVLRVEDVVYLFLTESEGAQ